MRTTSPHEQSGLGRAGPWELELVAALPAVVGQVLCSDVLPEAEASRHRPPLGRSEAARERMGESRVGVAVPAGDEGFVQVLAAWKDHVGDQPLVHVPRSRGVQFQSVNRGVPLTPCLIQLSRSGCCPIGMVGRISFRQPRFVSVLLHVDDGEQFLQFLIPQVFP